MLAISPSTPGEVFGQADGEIAAPKRAQGADELAAIEEVARGLDVHLTLRGFSPHPVNQRNPPAATRINYQTLLYLLPQNSTASKKLGIMQR